METTVHLAERVARYPRRAARASWLIRFLRRNPVVLAAAGALAVITAAGILAPHLAPHDPAAQDYSALLTSPGQRHLFGTDHLGRDLLSRMLFGIRVSLVAGLASVLIAAAVGLTVGAVAGFWMGWWDTATMRVVDALQAFPILVLATALNAVLGPGLGNTIMAVGVVYAPSFARLTRGQVLSLRHREFVEAARALGMAEGRVLVRHVLPNILGPLIVFASVSMATAIQIEASLSFLGLGVQPPTPSLGAMLREGYPYLESASWWPLLTGTLLAGLILCLNFFADGLRDLLDPRLQGRR
ncbi:MAG: ABC transporter permease [Armatimonadota bacterium]|nr:ABC transporter permease [Armatimonadota bacterium]